MEKFRCTNTECKHKPVLFEGELVPQKPTTDIVLNGHAYGRGGTQVDIGLGVGNLSKIIRVFGDRFWEFCVVRNRITHPQPFEKIPLIYERAFGGEEVEDCRLSLLKESLGT